VCVRQKRTEGSNPSLSASQSEANGPFSAKRRKGPFSPPCYVITHLRMSDTGPVSGEFLNHVATGEEIIKAAAARGCDLIWMVSHGRKGVAELLLGSETSKILSHSTIPVLVWR
jgi:hypothetical protein